MDSPTESLKEWYNKYQATEHINPKDMIIEVKNDAPIKDPIKFVDVHVNENFCSHCRHALDNWPSPGDIDRSYPEPAVITRYDIDHIEAATRCDCRLCSFLYFHLKWAKVLECTQKVVRRVKSLGEDSTIPLSVEYRRGESAEYRWGESAALWLSWPGKSGLGMLNLLGVPAYFFSSRRLYSTAENWLLECESHESCKRPIDLDKPTRLLSIADNIKLVITANVDITPNYATLSYSWGKEDFIKLTTANLNSFLISISEDKLPQTIKDAIYIARRLGIDYIWIDALCICQDDDEDWVREAGLMRAVYGGTFLNIAATSASDAHKGCFTKPDHYNAGLTARITTSDYCELRAIRRHRVYAEAVLDTNLATRAWTFQERLLANRTLYVGDQGFFWECNTKTGSEYFPDELGTDDRSPFDGRDGKPFQWGFVVEHYSRNNLTVSSDRLPALAGIARRHHEVTGDEYLAGMWRDRLVTQLCWSSYGKNKRPAWRAPSWSWVSVDGGARLLWYWDSDKYLGQKYAQVLDAKTVLAGTDPFGAVRSGILVLACEIILQAVQRPGQKVDIDKNEFSINLDVLEEESSDYVRPVYLVPLCEGFSGSDFFIPDSIISDSVTSDYFISDSLRSERETHFRGLVLEESSKGRFARIGSFNFSSRPLQPQNKDYNVFRSILNETDMSVASSVYKKVSSDDSDRRYVITIE